MSSELKKTDVNHTLGVKHSKHQPKWQHKVNPFCKRSQVKAHVFPTTSAGLFRANPLGPRFRGLPPLCPQLCLVQATLMGQLCLLQATLCLQQAALKLQALQGSNSEVVPSAGKPSQTLCWASCLAPGWSLSKSSSRLSIMWLITTALLGPSSAGATVPDGTSIPVAGGGLPGHSTFIGLLLLLLLLLLSPGAQSVPSLVGRAFFRPSPEGDFGDFGDLNVAFLGLGWWACCTTKSSINHLTLFLNCLTLMPVPSNQEGYCRL